MRILWSVPLSKRPAKQLPRTGHGDRLCKHTGPGSCVWWCTYRRFVKVCAVLVIVLAGLAALSFTLDRERGPERVRDAGIGVAIYGVVAITLTTVMNRRDDGDHY